MPNVTRILVPTDLSPSASEAFRVALDVAGRFEAEIHALHVRTESSWMPRLSALLGEPEVSEASYEQRIQEHLETHLHGYPSSKAVQRSGGRAAPEILEYARSAEADLIVLGTHGHRSLDHPALGGTAGDVVRKSEVPVLTVRIQDDEDGVPDEADVADEAYIHHEAGIDDEARIDDESGIDHEADIDDEFGIDDDADINDESGIEDEAGLRDKAGLRAEAAFGGFRRIVAAVDFGEHSDELVRWSKELARRYEARLAMIFVAEEHRVPIFSDTGMMSMTTLKLDDEIVSRSEAALRQLDGNTGSRIDDTTYEVRRGNPAREIVDFAHDRRGDLIVVGRRGHTVHEGLLLGTVTEHIVRRSRSPVLTMGFAPIP